MENCIKDQLLRIDVEIRWSFAAYTGRKHCFVVVFVRVNFPVLGGELIYHQSRYYQIYDHLEISLTFTNLACMWIYLSF